MSLPPIVSREEWLVVRKELLSREKESTRARDALNADRRRLPMVEIERDYVFHGPDGEASLVDLFEGRRQLIVDHFMFDPSWDDGCPSCSGRVDQHGNLAHLHARDTTMAVVSRAPNRRCGPPSRRSPGPEPFARAERFPRPANGSRRRRPGARGPRRSGAGQ